MQAEKTVAAFLAHALQSKATDIHLTPKQNEFIMKMRIGGELRSYESFSIREGERLISYLKFIASMDISEKRKPQSGSFKQMINTTFLSLRISTLPAVPQKESLVIRLLPQETVPPLPQLTLFPATARKLTSLLVSPSGLILLSGPTGSGKSTTLYSMVHYCASHLNKHVITLEDPVEKQHDSLLQIQVNEKAGITYATGLKAILRHDPDVIMVGEIRDEETARAAVKSALTGHLVLTSIHARNAAGVIGRLIELGVSLHEIRQTVIGVTAQRLVRVCCPVCGDSCPENCQTATRQAIICEMLMGDSLNNTLKEVSGEERPQFFYTTLQDQIRKGIAYGFLPAEERTRWLFQ